MAKRKNGQTTMKQKTVSAPTNRTQTQLSSAVSPSLIKSAYRSAMNGEPSQLFAVLATFARIDDEVISSMESLSSAVLSDGLKFTADKDAGDLGTVQAEIVSKLMDKLHMNDHLEHLLWMHFFGLSGFYVPVESWTVDTVNGQLIQCPSYLEQIPDHWLYTKYKDKLNILYIGDTAYKDLPVGSVCLVTESPIPVHQSCNFTEYGKGVAAMRHAIFKYYSEEDWSAMLEIFGQPMIVGKVGKGGSQNVVNQAVNEMAYNNRATIGENDTIELITLNGSGGSSNFELRVQRANNAISKVLKCETLTNNQGKVGSYAASKTSNGIRLDVAKKLARKLKDAVYNDFIVPLCEMNWGKCLITMDIPVRAAVDKLSEIRALTETGKHIPISANQLRSVSGAQAPVDDEDSINPRPQIGL